MQVRRTLLRLVKYILVTQIIFIVLGALSYDALGGIVLLLYPLLGLLLNILLSRKYEKLNMLLFSLLFAMIVFFFIAIPIAIISFFTVNPMHC